MTHKIKKGDVVVAKFNVPGISEDKAYYVLDVMGPLIKVVNTSGESVPYNAQIFKLCCEDLDANLRYVETSYGLVSKKIDEWQKELTSLSGRITDLKRQIAERDKPKGMVRAGDSLKGVSHVWLAHCNGSVYKKDAMWAENNTHYLTMGYVFYDEESAERAIHDRKQEVLLSNNG